MKLNQSIKFLLIAFIGGVSAIGVQQLFFDNQKLQIGDENHNWDTPVQNASFIENESTTPGSFAVAAENSVHAVVHILTEFTQKSNVYDNYFSIEDIFFGQGKSRVLQATGSGVIISTDGYIVTNNHVVQDASKITITLNDKRTFNAKLIGNDPSTDLALLKIEATELPFLIFGNSDEVKVGEWVLAVGNPFNLTSTVTAGIVSAKARNINILGDNSAIESFIQTDAVVNRGNSGGALVDTKGNLVGINAAIASGTGYYTGYSFAIPSMIVSKVVKDLKEYGKVQRAYLGIRLQEVNDKLAKQLNLKVIKGIYVESIINGGAAEKGGILSGDVILKVEGKETNSQSELLEQIGRKHPGDKVIIEILRDNKLKEIELILSSADGKTTVDAIALNLDNIKSLGASFEDVSETSLKKLGVSNGVKISNLTDGILKNAGIQEGFIITKIDKNSVKTPNEIIEIFKSKKGGVLIEGIYPNGVKAFYGFGL